MASEAFPWVPPGKLSSRGTHYILQERADCKGLVVFVHGIGTYHYYHEGLAGHVYKAGFSTLILDNLGMGHSLYPSEAEDRPSLWDGSGHVAQIQDLLTELSLAQKPHYIVGHSMGGALATLYAAKYPEVRGIILLSPSGVQSPFEPKILPVTVLRNALPSCLISTIFDGIKKDSVNIDRIRKFGDFIDEKSPASEASAQQILRQHMHNKSAIRALFNCARFFPLTSCHEAVNKVGASSVKVLVLHGDEDKTVRPTPTTTVWAKALSCRSDGISRVELVRGAHAFSLEYPEAIGKTLVEWLVRAGGAGDDLNRK